MIGVCVFEVSGGKRWVELCHLKHILKSICVEFGPGSYVSIMASFMLFVVDKYAWDFYMENANF